MGMVSAERFQITIIPTVLNNDAYDANDVIFDRTLLSHVSMTNHSGPLKLEQIEFWDTNDQTAAILTFAFLNSNVTYGTADAAPSISDANSVFLAGQYSAATAGQIDHTDFKYGLWNPNIIVTPAAGVLYVAMASAGTPTYLTGCLTLRFTFSTM